MNNNITKNNFDLIRLFAAFQVAITHASIHLGYKHPIIDAISFLPGVPIFFLLVVSAFIFLMKNHLQISLL